jgi:hypothetical protein
VRLGFLPGRKQKSGVTKSERQSKVRFFGYAEVIFDTAYLLAALFLGLWVVRSGAGELRVWVGGMAFVLAAGDSFHLLPRIGTVLTGDALRFQTARGFGKLVTSVTMTVFYLLLWQVGTRLFSGVGGGWTLLAYALAALRIFLCLNPQNRWREAASPLRWALLRNLSFVLLGAETAVMFWIYRQSVAALAWMWLAIALSFAFYIPVVVGAQRYPRLGMLMLPKSCMYLWMLWMLASMG